MIPPACPGCWTPDGRSSSPQIIFQVPQVMQPGQLGDVAREVAYICGMTVVDSLTETLKEIRSGPYSSTRSALMVRLPVPADRTMTRVVALGAGRCVVSCEMAFRAA